MKHTVTFDWPCQLEGWMDKRNELSVSGWTYLICWVGGQCDSSFPFAAWPGICREKSVLLSIPSRDVTALWYFNPPNCLFQTGTRFCKAATPLPGLSKCDLVSLLEPGFPHATRPGPHCTPLQAVGHCSFTGHQPGSCYPDHAAASRRFSPSLSWCK